MFRFQQNPRFCQPCLEKLTNQAWELACKDLKDKSYLKSQALEYFQKIYSPVLPPPLIASQIHHWIKEKCHQEDPYWSLKKQEIKIAQKLVPKLLPLYQGDLSSLMSLALLGNAIDFFRPPEEIEKAFEKGVDLVIDHRKNVIDRLKASSKVLYLTDNAGEIFFDLPFLKALSAMGIEIYYTVKPCPIQNDLSRQDIERLKIKIPGKVVDPGICMVGLLWHKSSPEFQKLFQKADLVIAKGMGHFETLTTEEGIQEKVVFMLCAKCLPVAQVLNVPLNSYLIWSS